MTWTNVCQRIDGFGASSAFSGVGKWNTNLANMFFSTNDVGTNICIGLSLLRNQIQPAPATNGIAFASAGETNIMRWAQDRGALVWSAPWSPPANFKNPQTLNGGSYLGVGDGYTNQLYAKQLAGYVANMKKQGISLYALSIQNEPEVSNNTYASCLWTAQQYHDFVTNLYSALVASNVASTKIMLPEDEHWQNAYDWIAMFDPDVATNVGIIADHNYDGPNSQTGDTTTPAALNNYGKALWETEVMTTDPFDGSIANALYWATRIHLFLTAAQANAYHYWWLLINNGASDNEALCNRSGNPAKRMYAFGQFSRFVRPGYYRINVGAAPNNPALFSAYKETNSSMFAIVAINPASTTLTQLVNLVAFPAVGSVTPWITSSDLSLASQSAVNVTNSSPYPSFTYVLPAMSVVTFVGQGVAGAPIATTLGLTTIGSPSTYGNAVTFTATVRTNGVAVGGISGETVTFYDGRTPLGTGTLNGSGQAAYTTGATQLSASTHLITAGYGGDAVYAGSTNSPALSQTVNPATLTAGLTGTVSKTYNGTTTATLAAGNYTLSGVVSGDTVTLNNPTSGTYDNRNQGTGKTVTVTGLTISGVSAGNYTLSSTSASAAVGTINQTNITVTAAANGKTYDGTTSAAATPTITSGSVQSGDAANFAETYDTRNQETGKTLTPSGSVTDGNSGNNYNYSFVNSANGTITAATLTYTANPANMTYGSAVPGLSGSVSGFVGSDTQGNATTGTLTFTTPATSSSGVGSYAINGSGLTANNGNYTFVQAAGNATALTINALAVNLTGSRPYDGTTTAAAGILTVANKVGSDDVTVASGSGTLAGANVGLEAITSLGTLGLGGTAAGSYTLSGAGGAVNITAAGLAVTNLLALDKVYDGTTNATLDATNAGLAGILNGDGVTLITSNAIGQFADKNVGTNKPVTVSGLALGGDAATNYAVMAPTNVMANITPAGLAVSGVTAANKVYDGTTAATLSGTAALNGQVNNDDVSLVTSNVTASFADANVGTDKAVTVAGYAITGADAGNYTLAQPAGLTADILPPLIPVLTGISMGSEGWQMSFSGPAGQSYQVLATDDLTLPLNQWTIVASGTFGSSTVTFTDSSTNLLQRFYRIISP
ncbi:MAG: YDG domain-containing protein [Verrucomicrobiota bacterium]